MRATRFQISRSALPSASANQQDESDREQEQGQARRQTVRLVSARERSSSPADAAAFHRCPYPALVAVREPVQAWPAVVACFVLRSQLAQVLVGPASAAAPLELRLDGSC